MEETLYYIDRGAVDPTDVGNYGIAREYNLLDALKQGLRPFCSDSPPTVLTFHEVWYTGAIDGDDRERHVREVGGFFVEAGADYVAE